MSSTALYGSWLALGMLGVVAGLVVWLRSDRRGRGDDLSDEDRSHFAHQDLRRSAVALVMVILAVGIYLGSRLPTLVNGRPNLPFVATWIGIIALILVLIILALIDWLATQRYARRHREIIVREGMKAFREEMQARRAAKPEVDARGGANGSPEERS